MKYLEAIENGALARHSDLRLLIWAKQGDSNHSRFFNKVRDAWAHCEKLIETHDLYTGLGLRHTSLLYPAIEAKRPLPRGGEADIHGMLGLAMEFDLGEGPRTKKNLFQTETEIVAFLETLPLRPTMTVASGGGVHVYWLFSQAWVFADGERELAKRMSTGWHRTVAALARRTVDPTFSLDRVYRVAGTRNHKYTPARAVEILSLDGPRYTTAKFDQYADTSAVPGAAPPGAVAALRGVKEIQSGKKIPQLPTPVANLVALQPEFADQWHHRIPGKEAWSQSEWDLSIANTLSDAGLDAPTIAAALAVNRFNNGAQVKPESYFVRTLAKVGVYETNRLEQSAGTSSFDQKKQVVQAQAGREKGSVQRVRGPAADGAQEGEAGGSGAGEAADEGVDGDRAGDNGSYPVPESEQFFAALSRSVGLSIRGIEYVDKGQGHDGFTFTILLHSGRRVPISRISMLRSLSNWKNTRVTCPQDHIPANEPHKVAWEELISKVLMFAQNCTIDENQVRMAIYIELSNYLISARPVDLSKRTKHEVEAYAHTGAAFFYEGGIYFGVPAFRKWYNMNAGKLEEGIFLQAMRDDLFEREKLGGRRFWKVSIDKFNHLVGGTHGKSEGGSGGDEEGTGPAWDSSADTRPSAGGDAGDPN